MQVIAEPFGRLLSTPLALPGTVHGIRAAREHGIVGALAKADIPCWADKGHRGADGAIRISCRGRWETLFAGRQAVNRSHAKIRALAEKAVATLKSWRLLRKLQCSTIRTTSLVQAVLTLHLTSSGRGWKRLSTCLRLWRAARYSTYAANQGSAERAARNVSRAVLPELATSSARSRHVSTTSRLYSLARSARRADSASCAACN